MVIDLDPQASAKGWHDHRQKESPVVISAQANRINDVLATARQHGADLCIIDTAPHSETAALAAARARPTSSSFPVAPASSTFGDIQLR